MNPEPDALAILAAEATRPTSAPADPRPEDLVPGGLAPVPGTGASA